MLFLLGLRVNESARLHFFDNGLFFFVEGLKSKDESYFSKTTRLFKDNEQAIAHSARLT